mmetsp:Transcript_8616/g.23867  ORF Transcript_8616/g.23867 Transcript_8616/m.23867 type:complete len:284 (-) Transcript_8616:250-1101(-)
MQILHIVSRNQNGLTLDGRRSNGRGSWVAELVGVRGIELLQDGRIDLSDAHDSGQQPVHVGVGTGQLGQDFVHGRHDGRVGLTVFQLGNMSGIGTKSLETVRGNFVEGKGIFVTHLGGANGKAAVGVTVLFQFHVGLVVQIQIHEGFGFRNGPGLLNLLLQVRLDAFDLTNVVGNAGRRKVDIRQRGKGGLERHDIGLLQFTFVQAMLSGRHAPERQALEGIEQGILEGRRFARLAANSLRGTTLVLGRLFALTTEHVGNVHGFVIVRRGSNPRGQETSGVGG